MFKIMIFTYHPQGIWCVTDIVSFETKKEGKIAATNIRNNAKDRVRVRVVELY